MSAALKPLSLHPGEVRVRGSAVLLRKLLKHHGATTIDALPPDVARQCVRIEAAADVLAQAPAALSRLQRFFEAPRPVHLTGTTMTFPDEPAFLEELHVRGLDLSTFRASMYLKGAWPDAGKPVRLIRQSPAMLRVRWARVEHCSPDTCASWQRPLSKRDCNFVLQSLSHIFDDTKNPDECIGLLGLLTALGFDERSLRMTARCTPQRIALYEAAQAT